MEFQNPANGEFTVYSKSGCPNCLKSKQFLKSKDLKFTVIDCDEYLLEAKQEFLEFIKGLAAQEVKMFPMIFDGDKYIGGYEQLTSHVDKMLDFDSMF